MIKVLNFLLKFVISHLSIFPPESLRLLRNGFKDNANEFRTTVLPLKGEGPEREVIVALIETLEECETYVVTELRNRQPVVELKKSPQTPTKE